MKNYMVRKQGDKWVVLDSTGTKVLGEHETEEEANKQLAAIEASKARRKMEIGGTEYEFDFEADLHTITDVDIFAAGTWSGVNSPPGGDKYEEKDLQSMVDAFNAGVAKPNIKITHGADKEQVDIGQVANLKVKAGKLFADFVNVPKALYELMKKGLFKARSAEVLWQVNHQGKLWPRVLKAVALLAPGQKPAVSAISEGYQFEAMYCYEWPQDRQYKGNIGAITSTWGKWAGSFDACVSQVSGKPGITDAKALCAWMEKRATGKWPAQHQAEDYEPSNVEVVAMEYVSANILREKEVEEMAIQELLKKYNARDEKHLEEILDAKEAELKEASKKAEKANEYEAERKKMREERVKTLITTLNKEGKVLPKHTEKFQSQLNKLYEAGMDEEAKALEAVLSEMPNLVEFTERAPDSDGDKDGEPRKAPGAEVDRLVTKYRSEGKAKSFDEAVDLIRTEHPEVWKAYATGMPGTKK